MWEILSFAVTVASECLGGLVGPHCGYVFFTDRKVRQLDGELKKLVNTREKMGHDVEEAQNNLKPIFSGVEKWVEDEQIVANKARSVLDGRAQKTCFCGWLPNPKARYCLGKDASKTVEEIRNLIEQRDTWEKIYYEGAPPGIVGGAANLNSPAADGGDIITGSRASIFQDIMEALGDDKLKVIGVYGPGGVGKTTLLKEVHKKLEEERRLFRMIVKAKVSQTPDLTKIQYDIAYALSLDLKDVPSEEGRRDLLFKRLQKDPSEKILIILDDLWKELDLEAVGIPNGDECRGCKLLLTSRYKDVLEQKMHADRTFRLQGLNKDEAFRLFEKKVGNKLKDEEELKKIATQVVEKLAGSPLLIISVASTLKCSDAPAWRNALIKIEESNVETIVKLAYDHLKKEDAKSLFLLCGLIGGTIQVETLLVLGMGLGLFERFNETMKDARDRLDTALEELRSACLLLDGGDDMENVTIHDLYSEVVVSTPFRGQNSLMMNSNYGSWSKEKLEKCWAICQADVGRDRLAQLMTCQFPNLKILMLSLPIIWRWMPEHQHDVSECSGLLDFTCMKELRVLYLRSMRITGLPSSIDILGNLHSLYLDHCDVEDVAILGKLEALQILSFAGSKISKLPKEIGDLTNLRSLNLSNCRELAIIEPGVLKGLINLEELLMQESFDRWMGNDEGPLESRNAKLAELKSVTRLTALEISIPDPTVLLEDGDLPFGNLVRFWIDIGNVNEFYGDFDGLRTMKLKLEDCDSILSKEWVKKTLPKTEYLHLDGLGEFKKNAYELCIQEFMQLKHLTIKNSPSIKYIASSSNDLPLTAFTKLESLFLSNLIHLEKIWNGPFAPDCFSKLKAVRIEKCHRLKNLGFLFEMQRHVHLEKIDVRGCDSIEYIANSSNGLPLTAFTKLESLSLENLINLEKIWNGPLAPDCFSKLKAVRIEKCHRLKNLGFPSEMQRLVHLEKIDVCGCDSLQAIITDDGGKAEVAADDRAVLPNVRLLDLSDLPNMLSFCTGAEGAPIQVSFPRLESLVMVGLNLDLEKILYRQPQLQYTNLKSIVIWKSKSTSSILKSDWILKLPNLESLCIVGCQSTKVVFDLEELKVTGHVEILSQLTKLTLSKLPDLQHVWKHDVKLQGLSAFGNLKGLEVKDAGLGFLFPVSVAKCLGEITYIEVEDCRNMKAVIVDEEGRDGGTDDIIEFPKLKGLRMRGCPTKKFFSSPSGERELVTTTSDSQDAYSDSFFDRKVSLPNLEVLDLNEGSFKRIWHGELLRSSFCELASITLRGCSELVNVFPLTVIGRLRHLKEVEVFDCPSLESLFDYEALDANTEQTRVLLPKLERVVVCYCPSLKSLFDCGSLSSKREQTRVLLPKLEGLLVRSCPYLESLFDCGSLDSNSEQTIVLLPKLEVLAVDGAEKLRHVMKSDSQTVLDFPRLTNVNCEQMKEVIPQEEGSRSKGVVMSFPFLTHINIQGCCNFGPFNSSPTSVDMKLEKTAEENDESPPPLFNEMVKLPNIRSLRIEGAQCKELWSNHIPDDSFCKLEYLKLRSCDNLQSVASSHMWKRLHRSLEILRVESCLSIKIIYEGDDTVMKSGKLRRLVLRDLKNLRHIWQSDDHPKVPLPSLRFIEVKSCPHLRMLFSTFTPDFLGQIKELAVESCEDMELIAGHEECEEATGTAITFSELIALRLFELPKFRSFLPEKYSGEFPSLQVLSRVSCGTEQDQCLGDWAPSEEPIPDHWISVGLSSWRVI